jgi:hypothetical protein
MTLNGWTCNLSNPRFKTFDDHLVVDPPSLMDLLSRATRKLQNLPDPLVFALIAIVASGAIYSTVQHARSWKPRKTKSVKLRGEEGKKIEDCTSNTAKLTIALTSRSLGVLSRSTNYNVAFA